MLRRAGIDFRCLSRRRAYSPLFALKAARAIARSDADIFHVFLPTSLFYVALARVLFRARQPIVYSEATSQPLNPRLQPMREWLLRTQCAGFAANSEASRDFLVRQGIPLERIVLIPNGHDVRQFQRPLDREKIRASIGIHPTDRLAIFVGRLVDTKRVCDLLAATAIARQSDPRLRVAIVGYGPEQPALEAQTLQAGLGDIVQFLGTRGDVADLLRAADMFVFPSEVEGLSNAVIEAALAGLPIVGCDIGGVRDVVANNRAAILVSPRNPQAFATAMLTYLRDEGLARQYGDEARREAENCYALPKTLERLYGLYDQVLSKRS
jgi:glycosyltransferase involved in cell wall biosynthesis